MPNHVANILTFNGETERVNQILAFIQNDEQALDFNKIIPMPETYRKYDTTNHPNARGLEVGKHIGWRDDSPLVTEELIEEYKRATKEQAELYGAVGWYDWSREYWGTKWNAYDCIAEGNTILFDTAWNAPLPIYEQLARMFPDIELHIVFADEDAGCNTGELTFKNGELVEENFPEDDTDESWALYFATHDYATDYYKKVDGKWRYVEDED